MNDSKQAKIDGSRRLSNFTGATRRGYRQPAKATGIWAGLSFGTEFEQKSEPDRLLLENPVPDPHSLKVVLARRLARTRAVG